MSERPNMVDIEMFGLPVDTVRKGVMKTQYQVGPHPKWDNHGENFEVEIYHMHCVRCFFFYETSF